MRVKNKQIWDFGAMCLLCGVAVGAKQAFCRGCEGDLPRPITPCNICGNEGVQSSPCGACMSEPPQFDATVAAYSYAAPVSWLVRGFKFRRKLAFGRALGEALAGRCEALSNASVILRPEVIVPVPLHRKRQRERGFNQALELARHVGRMMDIPVASNIVTRVHATPEQSQLDAPARRRNIKNAFSLKPQTWRSAAIIDDVMTTGSTVGELAQTLKNNGCEHVQVWVAARAAIG